MIRTHIFDLGGGKTRRMYENLVPVGALRRGDNTNQDRASNQLVQFFLRKFFETRPAQTPPTAGGARTFLLDGKVGGQTVEGINRFQAAAQQAGQPLFDDSRVSVPIGVNVPGTQARWTIHALNSFFVKQFGEEEFDNLFANPEIAREAPELAAQLVAEEQLLRS
jgi:hypothetical protein